MRELSECGCQPSFLAIREVAVSRVLFPFVCFPFDCSLLSQSRKKREKRASPPSRRAVSGAVPVDTAMGVPLHNTLASQVLLVPIQARGMDVLCRNRVRSRWALPG